MKFRIRPPFKMFKSPDEAATYEALGTKSGIRPIAAGKVVSLTPEQASATLCRGQLGMLEPIDDEAKRFYGDTEPLVSTVFSHPERHAIRSEPKRVEFRMEAAR